MKCTSLNHLEFSKWVLKLILNQCTTVMLVNNLTALTIAFCCRGQAFWEGLSAVFPVSCFNSEVTFAAMLEQTFSL